MSVQTLYTAATGMEAMEAKLDVIANNLANVNTTGFKKDRANFEDLFYRNEVLPGALDANGEPTPTGISTGLGVKVSSMQTDHRQGAFEQTGKELDVAIEGQGFFQVLDPSGETYYTRAGNFNINANGQLVVGSAGTGRVVEPPIQFPNDTVGIVIGADGRVSIRQVGQANMSEVGQLQLAQFVNPDGLLKLGENMYAETDASNSPTVGIPGQNGLGLVRQNMLEASNVQPVRELIDLITTQRSFELNSQTVQAGDQVLQLVANLRRY
jgi:flagellar basal-body rod protein FlgG